MSERDRNRREFPALASISDEVRKVFPNARLIHGEEGGREVGRNPMADGAWIDLVRDDGELSLYELAVMRGGKRK